MGTHRSSNRLIRSASKRRQSGMTLIGMLLLAVVFGVIGLAILKIVPMYMQKMRVGTVLEDLQEELAVGGNSAQGIKLALDSRFYVENLRSLTREELEITSSTSGFTVAINREVREPFLADLFFVVVVKEEIEIAR